MDGVWIKSGEEQRYFSVEDGFVPVDDIAGQYGLDSKTLAVGELALLSNPSGNCLFKLDEIIQFSREEGLGDGSKEQPLPIHGRKQVADPSAEFAKTELGQAFARSEAQRADFLRTLKLRRAREDLRSMEWYGGGGAGGLYRHISDRHLIHEKLPRFVCSVHIVSSKQDALDSSNSTGLASLVKLDGTCITHPDCLQLVAGDDPKLIIMVKFFSGASYECKGNRIRADDRVVLEPVDKISHTFDQECMYVGRAELPFKLLCVVRTLSPSLKTVYGLIVDKQAALFNAVDLKAGSPVLTFGNHMIGIVKNGKLGTLPRHGKKMIKLSSGRGFAVDGTAELTTLLNSDKCLPNYRVPSPQAFLADLRAVIDANQLVEILLLRGKTAFEEWDEEHALEDFAGELAAIDARPYKRPQIVRSFDKDSDLLKELYPDDHERIKEEYGPLIMRIRQEKRSRKLDV